MVIIIAKIHQKFLPLREIGSKDLKRMTLLTLSFPEKFIKKLLLSITASLLWMPLLLNYTDKSVHAEDTWLFSKNLSHTDSRFPKQYPFNSGEREKKT